MKCIAMCSSALYMHTIFWAASSTVCCSVLQCVALRCSVLQCIAVCCSVLLQCVAAGCCRPLMPPVCVRESRPSPNFSRTSLRLRMTEFTLRPADETWRINMRHDSFTWDMTHSCETLLIYITHNFVAPQGHWISIAPANEIPQYETWLIRQNHDFTLRPADETWRTHMSHDSFIWAMTHSYEPRLIYMSRHTDSSMWDITPQYHVRPSLRLRMSELTLRPAYETWPIHMRPSSFTSPTNCFAPQDDSIAIAPLNMIHDLTWDRQIVWMNHSHETIRIYMTHELLRVSGWLVYIAPPANETKRIHMWHYSFTSLTNFFAPQGHWVYIAPCMSLHCA